MIYLTNGRTINPAFVEYVDTYKATLNEVVLADGDKEPYYFEDAIGSCYWVSSENAVVVGLASGTVREYCGEDAKVIIQWYGIHIPEGMFEGPAPHSSKPYP